MASKRGLDVPPTQTEASSSGALAVAGAAAVDRLSALPDEILHHAMSFLKAREAVQTCLLSKRWTRLWRSMPYLDIDQWDLLDASGQPREFERFADFANNLLMSHGAPRLEIFKLRVNLRLGIYGGRERSEREYSPLNYDGKKAAVLRWICRGIKCCPSVLGIDLGACFVDLPSLGSGSYRLTRLHLRGVRLPGSFAEQLKSGFPMLEDLVLGGCSCEFHEITSRTLKNLVFDCCTNRTEEPMIITAPILASLLLTVRLHSDLDGILVTETSSLIKASICVRFDDCSGYGGKNMCRFLGSLNNVKNLEMARFWCIQGMLNEESIKFPMFHNLRTLLFNECVMWNHMHMFWQFLSNAPGLEKVTLLCCKFSDPSKKRKRKAKPKRISLDQQEVTNFDCKNLKLIEIQHKNDNVHELFELLSGSWSNLRGATIKLTKVES